MSIIYDPDLVSSIAHTLDLRAPNAAALDALAQRLEEGDHGVEMVADLATGVGKTYIAGALIDYLAEQGVRNILFVTPGSTIQKKTINNFTPGHPKHLKEMTSKPLIITLDDVEAGIVGTALDDPNQLKVFVVTVQSLMKPNSKDGRRAHRAHEAIGQPIYEYLQNCGDLVVIADEHHIYYSGSAKKFQSAIDDLHPVALVGLTATPHEKSEPNIVFRYPLAAAIADGFVKIPVLVGRTDTKLDLRTQMADAVALLDAKAVVMREFCKQTRREFIQPVLFVVASKIDEANDIAEMLGGPDMFGDRKQVLVITSEEPDETLAKLDTLEDPGSSYRAVVSVSMLKEGWDNKAIYVIVAVRALESQLLTEQILGRGLRLPFGQRVGVSMLDTVEVVSHHAFKELLKEAKVLLEQTLGDRQDVSVVVDPTPGIGNQGVPAGNDPAGTASEGEKSVEFHLPGSTPANNTPQGDGQDSMFDDEDALDNPDESHIGLIISDTEQRLADAKQAAETLAKPLKPRSPGGVKIPLFLPRVTTKWVRDPFALSSINVVDAEALGRIFANDDAPTLTRKMLDAERDKSGQVKIVIHDANGDPIAATQQAMPFDTIETDIVARLLRTDGITASTAEANAALAITKAFLKGADVTEATPWRKEHGQLATTRLAEWIGSKQTSSPGREVKEVTQVKWPDVEEERVEAQPAADRQLVTSSAEFVRSYPYEGWDRSIYAVASFDAYSTEFKMAELFEKSTGIKAWVRITRSVPLRMTYIMGAIQREYEPDFVVVDSENMYWIVEGKSNSAMSDPIVIAKRDAAVAWVNAVNASEDVHEKWGYILASESVVANAGTWASLKAGAQTFA